MIEVNLHEINELHENFKGVIVAFLPKFDFEPAFVHKCQIFVNILIPFLGILTDQEVEITLCLVFK